MGFAENLKLVMDDLGWSNYKIAQYLGCSQTSVSNWINGVTFPHKKARKKISEALGFSVDQMDQELPGNHKEIVSNATKRPAGEIPSGPAMYEQLSPEHRAIVDQMIELLYKKQSGDQ